jgi:flagellar hook-length control protein FliK
MQNLPISLNVTPVATPQTAQSQVSTSSTQASQATAGASDNAAASSSGENFNTVLARQLATEAGGATAKDGQSASTQLAGNVLVVTTAADKATKSTDKQGASTAVDGVTAAAQSGMMALMATPMVAAESKPVATSLAETEAPSGTRMANAQTILNQLQADETNGAAGKSTALQPAVPGDGTSNASATQDLKFSTALQVAADLHAAGSATGQNLTAASPDPAKDARLLAQSQVQAQNQVAGSQLPVANAAQNLTVNTPVGSNRWNEDLGQKITWMANSSQQSAELHLNPPDLGPLNVVLHVSGDQATAMFTSPHAAVRDAVEQALPKLREMLAGNGIMLGNASVSDQGRQSGQNGFSGGGKPSASSGSGANEVSSVKQGIRPVSMLQTQGLVDTFA